MIDVLHILFRNSPNEHNQKLCAFIETNLKLINSCGFHLDLVIIPEQSIPKLSSSGVSKLPALKYNKDTICGVNGMKERMIQLCQERKKNKSVLGNISAKDTDEDSELRKFQDSEMHDDVQEDDDGNEMAKVVSKAAGEASRRGIDKKDKFARPPKRSTYSGGGDDEREQGSIQRPSRAQQRQPAQPQQQQRQQAPPPQDNVADLLESGNVDDDLMKIWLENQSMD